jgi:hypothetical protein
LQTWKEMKGSKVQFLTETLFSVSISHVIFMYLTL